MHNPLSYTPTPSHTHLQTQSKLMFIASCTMYIGQFPFIKSDRVMESPKATGIYHPLRPLTSTVPTFPTPTPTPTAQLPAPTGEHLHKQQPQLYIFLCTYLYLCACSVVTKSLGQLTAQTAPNYNWHFELNAFFNFRFSYFHFVCIFHCRIDTRPNCCALCHLNQLKPEEL